MVEMLTHNLARPGSLRRRLGLPNPILFHQLASLVSTYWSSIQKHLATSRISKSLPTIVPGRLRCIAREHELSDRPRFRAQIQSSARYMLRTDILDFYGSVYTHSIPWALHTKEVAKKNRGLNFHGLS